MSVLLVTGAAGRTGRWFLRSFAERDRADRPLLRLALRRTSDVAWLDRFERELAQPIDRRMGDLADDVFVDEIVRGTEVILHIAGIRLSPAVVQAAIRHRVRWIVLVHTTGIYSKYRAIGEEYRRIEASIEESVDAFVDGAVLPSISFLRPTMIYGSLADRNVSVFIRMVDRLPFIPLVGDGRHLLQPVHERDLGRAYDLVLKHESTARGRHYVLSGRDPISLRELLSDIAAALARRAHFVRIPFPLAYGVASTLNALTFGGLDLREKIQRLVEDRAFSHDDATRDFGFAPRSFAEGIREEVDSYLALRGAVTEQCPSVADQSSRSGV